MKLPVLLSVCLLGATLPGCDRPASADPHAAPKPAPPGLLKLNVASFNIRYENSGDSGPRAWRQRLAPVVHAIRRMNPDIMGVQEALHHQVEDLQAELTDYGFHGVGRDDGRQAGEYSGIFYRRDRFKADWGDSGTFWLSDQPETPGSRTWGNTIPRVAAWLRLVDRTTGRGCYIFNTHWDHQSQPSRERAALLIAQRIDTRKHADEPVILTGDFNAPRQNPASDYLRGQTVTINGSSRTWPNGLLDTHHALHPDAKNCRTFHNWTGADDGPDQIDFILISKTGTVGTAAILRDGPPWPSDHFPVHSTVTFPANFTQP